MEQSTAQRRLVKSPPELWAEVSSEDTLRRHLSEFGEIRITRVHPETTVAWEGDRASGTVELVHEGWGTRVVLTATPVEQAAPAEVEPEPEPAPEPEPERFVMPRLEAPVAQTAPPAPAPASPARRGFFARLFHRAAPAAEIPPPGPHDPSPPVPAPDPSPPTPSPTPPPAPAPAPDPVPPTPAPDPVPPQIRAPAIDGERTVAILTEVLDDLGAAHHRPFSRD
jgi:hypothetical protein